MKSVTVAINQIKQEIKRGSKSLKIKKSNHNKAFLNILKNEGLVQHYSINKENFEVYLRYDKNKTNIIKQVIVSTTPTKNKEIKGNANPYGINVIMTNNVVKKYSKVFKKKVILAKII